MSKKTLVIMAGGLGTRFGGLKQVEPVDENKNFIIDYSIYDAVKVGFDKVIFIIKKENFKIFDDTIGSRVKDKIKVEYAFQGIDDFVPMDVDYSKRTKPWGTGHAVLCAKDKIDGDFAVVNADDFYGRDGFRVASKFFDDYKNQNLYANVCYKAGNTLTDNGAVKRGVCEIKNGYLVDVKESSIEKKDGKIYATELGTENTIEIQSDCPVSMNLICFRKNYLTVLEERFKAFLYDKNTNIEKDEFLLLNQLPYAKKLVGAEMMGLQTSAVWYGFTYKEDKEKVVSAIRSMRDKGEYPADLWDTLLEEKKSWL